MRRATLFKSIESSDPGDERTLFIAGAFEFLPLSKEGMESADLPKALSQAYGSLGYDAGYLVPGEAQWLTDHGAEPPAGFVTASDRVQEKIIEKNGLTIGLIFFPKLIKGADSPSDQQLAAVDRKAESLAERTDLVIGLSPWGDRAERKLLADFAPPIHLLLGAGPGPGLTGRFSDDGKTLWIRSYRQGKAVHKIRVRRAPTREADWKWIKDGNISLSLEVLDKNVSDDADMASLLGGYTLPEAK